MKEKHVDGVKKLSKEELDKSRKIVLDAISDRRVAKKADTQGAGAIVSAVDAVKRSFKKNIADDKSSSDIRSIPSTRDMTRKKQEPIVSEPEVKLSKEERDKARDELSKIIPSALPAGRGRKEEIPEKKIVSKPKEEIKPISKEPVIKLSREKKKKWRDERNTELDRGKDKKSESSEVD